MSGRERKSKWMFGGCGSCLFFFVGALLVVWFVVGRTGLVTPLGGYQEPQPERTIQPQVGLDGVMQMAASSLRVSADGPSLVLTEEMMTVGLREGLGSRFEDQFDVERAQVVVSQEQNALEIFLPLKAGARETAMRLYVLPSIVEGDVNIDVTRVMVGNLVLPDLIAADRVESALNALIDGQLSRFQDTFTLVDVELSESGLELQLEGIL